MTRQPLFWMFVAGVVLGLFGKNPDHQSPILAGLMFMTGGGLAWYAIKAILITGRTILTWNKAHPGEPMFRAGGLTEYDEDFAERIGRAAAKARKEDGSD